MRIGGKKGTRKRIREGVGTPFQKEVWEALLAIPRGETRSYRWVAQKISRPKAVRAVANACGANPYAPEVPCHRVICSDGQLGGYSRGIAFKKRLLWQEGIFFS
ncbi:MAG: MGMT family protein [Deltaproteobacteria bacterium]|nr:MGMT family protein [Deltaproteobacteria bacterium]